MKTRMILTVNGRQQHRPPLYGTTTTTINAHRRGSSSASMNALSKTECPICLELFHCPITTRCGHSFCFHCLFLSTIRDCPMCRQGPLLVEAGDFEPDHLLELRVKLERAVAFAPLPSAAAAGRAAAIAAAAASEARRAQLEPPEQLLGAYRRAMLRWKEVRLAELQKEEDARWEEEEEEEEVGLGVEEEDQMEETKKERVGRPHSVGAGKQRRRARVILTDLPADFMSSPQFAAATLIARSHLGRRMLSQYTHDENRCQQMFFDGGFMWRMAPSLLVSVSSNNNSSTNGNSGGNRTRSGHNPIASSPVDVQRKDGDGGGGGDSHIDYLIELERRKNDKRSAGEEKNDQTITRGKSGGGSRRTSSSSSTPSQTATTPQKLEAGTALTAALQKKKRGNGLPLPPPPPSTLVLKSTDATPQAPLPPLTITPRGRIWVTAAGTNSVVAPNGTSSATTTTTTLGRLRPPSAGTAIFGAPSQVHGSGGGVGDVGVVMNPPPPPPSLITSIDLDRVRGGGLVIKGGVVVGGGGGGGLLRRRPQSAAEAKEDAQLLADTRQFIKRQSNR